MDYKFAEAVGIFITAYAVIVSEKLNRTVVAMVGAMLLLLVSVMNQEEALHYVDFNTLGILIGMMLIVNIMRPTGVFEYLAIRAAKAAKGEPFRILVSLSLITAAASALLDNVTTVLLIVPVTLIITDKLGTNPFPFLISEILFANIGGTATLIGDPPNIMIGSATGLGFMDFIINMAPAVLIISGVNVLILKYVYRGHFTLCEVNRLKVMAMDENEAIKDHSLLWKCSLVLFITMAGFVFHQQLGYESATVALGGAALLLLITRIEPDKAFLELEWNTLFFFIFLFLLVGGLEAVGAIDALAGAMLTVTHGNLFWTAMMILWGSAILSSILDNIPFVAAMIPMIKAIGALSGMDIEPLWWALALGACLGGNGTLIGASANVIVSGIAAKHGSPIGFYPFFKIGFPLMLLSIVISTGYMILVIL